MRTVSMARIHHLGQKAWAAGLAASHHPIDFLTYLIRQSAAYEQGRSSGSEGTEGTIQAAIDERLRPFMMSPPSTLLPSRSLEEVCCPQEPLDIALAVADHAELPEPERKAIAQIVGAMRPQVIFEIGTYRGRTTCLLAAASPLATVHTLDLPPKDMLAGGCFHEPNPTLIGAHFKDERWLRTRIIQHHGDSRYFDFGPFRAKVDLVFVDASHAFDAVLSDSHRAFEMIKKGGVVLWDDYHPVHGPGVMRALADISAERSLAWIKGTRLAMYGSVPRVSGVRDARIAW